MIGALDLLGLSRAELRELLRQGHPIEASDLDDCCYRGVSLGLPAWVDRLSWKTFMKAFHRDPATGLLRGWNLRLEQDGVEAPCRPQRRPDGSLLSFGHFEVVDPEQHSVPQGLGRGLLIHYGRGGNARLDPLQLLRDPIVALQPGDPSLLLGWSYLDLGLALPTPSYFSLELVGPLGEPVRPPRAA
ncbi:MAG: hypothetical protein VX498_14800 [Myxococcota bacterium]|nr:hypothetical protein [Myxococcota bacterium]